MSAKIVSVLNMKGGVGKTTVSNNIFRSIVNDSEKKVLLLDMDPQFNLTQSLIRSANYQNLQEKGKTILACFEGRPSKDFFSVKRTTDLPPSPSKLAKKFPTSIGAGYTHLIVGTFELIKYSIVDDRSQLDFAAHFFKKFIESAKEKYDIIVIDCNPSSSFLTMCALNNSTHILSPVTPTRYSLQGIQLLNKLLLNQQLHPKKGILINKVDRYTVQSPVENSIRIHPDYGPTVFVNKLHKTGYLDASDNYIGFGLDRPAKAHFNAFKGNLQNVGTEILSWIES